MDESNSDMISQQESVESDSPPKRYSAARVLELAGCIAVGSYFLLLILYVVPFYNRWYRVPVNLLNSASCCIGIVAVVFVLLPLYLFTRRFRRGVVFTALVLLLFFATRPAYSWRVQLTERLIQAYYCGENRPAEPELVLGGIINTGGGWFINDSHCLIMVCDEEFYYCDRPAERQSDWRER